jgi:alcohol dehydrogenase class IV
MIQNFDYFQPTKIKFGAGRIAEIGDFVSEYGKKCVLVTVPLFDDFEPIIDKVKLSLNKSGVSFIHFDKVIQNPTTDIITQGADIANDFGAEVVLGLGGGSSMDSAKAIAVEAMHDGTAWDYLFFKEKQPNYKTLPIITATTTAGTGSQVTQVAVLSNSKEKRKSAIYNSIIFPKVSIVDPELTITVPPHITASTGFDVFTHAFEAYIHKNTSPYVELISLEAIRLVIKNLPMVIKDGKNLQARTEMSWADTLAGLSIANAGVTLPHGIGMAIGGCCSNIMHGEALAAVYPEFIKYTYKSSIRKFATLARLFDQKLENVSDNIAAEKSCYLVSKFLNNIDMNRGLEKLGVSVAEITEIAEKSMELPDYTNNPRVANIDEVTELLKNSYKY